MSDGAQEATPRGATQPLPTYQPYLPLSAQVARVAAQQPSLAHPFQASGADGFPRDPTGAMGSSSRSNSNGSSAQGSGSDGRRGSQPTSSHSDSSGGQRKSTKAAAPQAVPGKEYSDRSCGPCRDRRVRCDRLWPSCERCIKRHEDCIYPKLANVTTKSETPPDPRVVELETKLASVQEQLRVSHGSTPNYPLPHPPPPFPPPSAAATPLSPAIAALPPNLNLADQVQGSVLPNPSQFEEDTLRNFLAGERATRQEIGPGMLDWRLMQPSLAEALTQSLLDASGRACCSRLPALKCLVDRIPIYKSNLHSLDAAGQLAVAVLCSLGARAAPHSAILGVPTQALSDGTATPALYLTAGEKREKACRSLEMRAHEIAWGGKVLREDTWANLESLAALTQLLIFEEARAKPSRFFLRNALGMYVDLVLQKHGPGDAGFEQRQSVGMSLFADDTTIAPRFNRPCMISSSELEEYFARNGVQTPDIENTRLGTIIDGILASPVLATRQQLQEALATTALWVCQCQRIFSKISTAPRPGVPAALPEIHKLYTLIDEVHGCIQRLQQYLVNVSHIPAGCEGDLFALDHFVLLGVRADTYLVDLVNLTHTWLKQDRTELSGLENWEAAEEDERLHKLRWESGLRVRKCLKLVAFYSQLYLASSDKHVVHHLTIQLELLPGWTTLVTQRVGEPDGPLTEEFELTEEELDWLRQALELACYFTPVAGQRLQELCSERAKRSSNNSSPENPLSHHSPADPRPSLPSTSNPFGDAAAAATSLYTFDTLGVVRSSSGDQQSPLLGSYGAAGALAGQLADADSMASFEGNSWMDMTLNGLWDESTGTFGGGAGGFGGDGLGGSEDAWMG